MPLFKTIPISPSVTVFLWKITEEYDVLLSQATLKETSVNRLQGMKSESHQKGFVAVRLLFQEAGYSDFDLYYDAFGKPHLQDGKHISISHSHDFSAIVISEENIGIDLEQIKDKVLRIAPRFMDISHLEGLSEKDKLRKATVVWGVKEAVFKLKNEVGISFPDHITESPFELSDGKCTARLQFNHTVEDYRIGFEEIENYALVWAMKSE